MSKDVAKVLLQDSPAEQYYTVKEVAAICRIHRQTVYGWLRKKIIPAKQIRYNSPWYIEAKDIPTFYRDRYTKEVKSKHEAIA